MKTLTHMSLLQNSQDVIPGFTGIHRINHLQTKTVTSQKVRALLKSAQSYLDLIHVQLRVILLPDGKTIHNAFFDRGYKP